MTTIIYFVRHAEPDHRILDDQLRPLTEKGLRDAMTLAELFSDIRIDKVIIRHYKTEWRVTDDAYI